jgi:nucleoside-diphosphate kinase
VADALLIFKPDACYRLAVRTAINQWVAREGGWKVQSLQWYQAPTELIESHYDFLRERPFFPWLVDFMTALPVLVGRIGADPAALERMRFELGETRIQESRPGSLRELYGIHGGINCVHLSDSPESGRKELELWEPRLGTERIEVAAIEAPDHTFHLRSLAGQIAAGIHMELAAQEMRRLLQEESELEGDRFEALSRIILGALS